MLTVRAYSGARSFTRGSPCVAGRHALLAGAQNCIITSPLRTPLTNKLLCYAVTVPADLTWFPDARIDLFTYVIVPQTDPPVEHRTAESKRLQHRMWGASSRVSLSAATKNSIQRDLWTRNVVLAKDNENVMGWKNFKWWIDSSEGHNKRKYIFLLKDSKRENGCSRRGIMHNKNCQWRLYWGQNIKM